MSKHDVAKIFSNENISHVKHQMDSHACVNQELLFSLNMTCYDRNFRIIRHVLYLLKLAM